MVVVYVLPPPPYLLRETPPPGSGQELTRHNVQQGTLSGASIAEWVMNNGASINLKYVIWGQKIWSPTQDSVGSWTNWRTMEDRGDITQNHW